jgi:hypothetical protein
MLTPDKRQDWQLYVGSAQTCDDTCRWCSCVKAINTYIGELEAVAKAARLAVFTGPKSEQGRRWHGALTVALAALKEG